MMKFVLLFGPPAVGKMTVGQELAQITGLKLFHNHMSLELVNQFFDFGTPSFEHLDKVIRFEIFREVAKSDLAGLIFTYVWAFDEPADTDYIQEAIGIFEEQDAQIYLVELTAELDERLKRNRDEHRLAHKPSKRDIAFSEKSLLYFEANYRMHSKKGELATYHLLKMDNTHLSAAEAAEKIKKHFNW